MYICSIWFDFEIHNLLGEKIKQERVTRSMICNEVLSDFVKVASEFVSLRFSFSISTDWSMLYYAIVSLFPYLNKSDVLTCRRFNHNFSIILDISFVLNKRNNRLFHLLFYMCMFTHDSETDLDCVYQFWTHGNNAIANCSNVIANGTSALHFRRRNIAFDGVYDAYFFSKFDANLWYHVSAEVASQQANRLFALLVCSLYNLSFVNTNLNSSFSLKHG